MTSSAPRPYAKTEQIITTLKPVDLDRLDAAAAAAETSRAEMIRRFVLAGLDDAEPVGA